MHDITVRFGPLCAVDKVSLSFRPGEIHAIVGENGAGKSTVMSVLFGLQTRYGGQIAIDGAVRAWQSPKEAIEAGIGMVHQHFMLQDSMTVLENIILCAEPAGRLGFVDFAAARRQVGQLIADYGLELDAQATVADLAVGERQMVEILRLLYRKSTLLILDEPTAVLTPMERDRLFASLQQFRASGKSIVLITHKIDEVFALADRVSVMRAGKLVASGPLEQTDRQAVARQIVGGELPRTIERRAGLPSAAVLQLDRIEVEGMGPRAEPLDLEVRAGEIVGIAGVSGNGQAELVQAVVGLRYTQGGSILLAGQDVTQASVGTRRACGLSYIPEDRQRTGLALDASVTENACIGKVGQAGFAAGPFLRKDRMAKWAERMITQFSIKASDAAVPVRTLSGGNKQKLVVARELAMEMPLIVIENPTWGVDIGAISFIHAQIMQMREQGHAILLVSSELDEILALSDRIFVMYEGRLSPQVLAEEASRESLGSLMISSDRRAETQTAGSA